MVDDPRLHGHGYDCTYAMYKSDVATLATALTTAVEVEMSVVRDRTLTEDATLVQRCRGNLDGAEP